MDISTTTRAQLAPASFGRTVRAYIALTKPRVLELLLVTTVPVMILAQQGFPPLWLVVATVASFSPNDTPGLKMMLKIRHPTLRK